MDLDIERPQEQEREDDARREDQAANDQAQAEAAEAMADAAARTESEDAAIPPPLPEDVLAASSQPGSVKAGEGGTASDRAMGAIAPPKGHRKRPADDRRRRKQAARSAPATPLPSKGAEKGSVWTADSLAKLLAAESAATVVQRIAENDTANGIKLLKTANAWDRTLLALPTGTALTKATRFALFQLVAGEHVTADEAKTLFGIRFKHAMTDTTGKTGASWTRANIAIVWRQLDRLPDSDVTQNTVLSTFQAISGSGGFGPSWEAPTKVNTIQLGQSADPAHLPHTVRHEVGHGVHAQMPGPINEWLQNDMQFWFTDFDTWIGGLGELPKKYTGPDGKEYPFDDTARAWVKHCVDAYTGQSSWDPARATPASGESAWVQAMWAAMPAKVKNACAQSVSHWYNNWTNFQESGGKRYFLNHWYHRPFTIGATAASAISATGDNYTAMSEKEFFANCYAEYFADPAGIRDKSKWGGKLPAPVKTFFAECVVARHPYSDFQAKEKKRKEGGGAG